MLEKPREKMQKTGPECLKDNELMSIILGRGTRKENVFDLSQRLFKNFDREELINEKRVDTLKRSLNTGFVQTCQIMACIELGKRLFRTYPGQKQIQSIEDTYQIVKNMQYLKKEYLRGLYINSRFRIIHDEIISIGSLDSNVLHPREIYRPAIEYGAYAIILAHNHPSGDCKPSQSDINVSKKLQEIGNLLQIPLMDHLIVGENSYTSLKRAKLI